MVLAKNKILKFCFGFPFVLILPLALRPQMDRQLTSRYFSDYLASLRMDRPRDAFWPIRFPYFKNNKVDSK